MSSTNPFDEGDTSNPFFDTVKIQSAINEDAVFGGQNADEPVTTTSSVQAAPMPDIAVPGGSISSSSTSSHGAAVFDGEDDDESKPINFEEEQAKHGKNREMQEPGFTDKAVNAAANILFDDGEKSGEGQKEKRKWYHFWKPSFYRPYFDVDTKDVFARCFAGLVPVGKPFFERIQGNPDLYGPFWVTTTILFLLAISSNFAEYIAYHEKGVDWDPDFYKVSIAAAVFYAFLIGVPLILWALQRFMVKAKVTLFQNICVYGYSMTSFLVCTPFCICPFEWARWVAIIIACIISCACISVALFKSLKHDMVKGTVVIVVAIVFQLALSLTYKVYFFAEIDVPPKPSSSSAKE